MSEQLLSASIAVQQESQKSTRLLSLDFMRGCIMILLSLEATGLWEHLSDATGESFIHPVMEQFFHHPWHGLRAWDLIQPAFMFMAGAAMAFSLQKQEQLGVPWSQSFYKTLKRCGWLFFWGVLIDAVKPDGLSFELWNVLTQLSFTTLIAFLVFRWSFNAQVFFSVGLLLLTEILYRFIRIPGFDQPFTDQHNFGNYVDLLLMNKINDDGWVAINCIPTAVHTIAGAMAGKILRTPSILEASPGKSSRTHNLKIKQLLLWGILCLFLGYALDLTGITPIIKRIATSSFTLVSLGYSLLILASCYGWIDVRNHRKGLQFFLIVGMNSIFIYLFFMTVGGKWFNGYVSAVVGGLLQLAGADEMFQLIASSLCIFGLEWWLCYFLYRHKIFFRL